MLATSRAPSPGRRLAHVVRITACLSARELIPSKPRTPDITSEIREDKEESCQTESSENRIQLSQRARQRGPPAALQRGNTAEAKPSRIWGLRALAARHVLELLQVSKQNTADCAYNFYYIEDD